MTKAEFLKKYYPTSADSKKRTLAQALRHSIRKWRGVRAVQQGKIPGFSINKCAMAVLGLWNDVTLSLGGVSCALCQHFAYNFGVGRDENEPGSCHECPIAKAGEICVHANSAYSRMDSDRLIQIMQAALAEEERK